MEPKKKQYKTPELIVHGDLRKITRRGSVGSNDVPIGEDLADSGIVIATS